jgi:Rrf2 family protein
MELTRASEYGVRCILFLASRGDGRFVSRREISDAMDIPFEFLGKIAQQLTRAGLLEVVQGARGGYRLALPPEEISLLGVVEAMEGDLLLNRCLMRTEACDRAGSCPVHAVWAEARRRLRETLAAATFADLVRQGGAPPAREQR